jgi:hypothetical protein
MSVELWQLAIITIPVAWFIFALGFRYGVDVTVNVYLDEALKDTTQAAVRHSYITERREVVKGKRDAYQDWRRKYKLPDTPDTRALYNDADYRASLEAQEAA